MIKVENLVKTFGTKRAVNGISFSVERGEVLGFLGPNGAGKSTSMRMITGFIPPTEGRITVGGHDMLENPIPAKRLIGYLPENASAYTDMTVHGFLSFSAELRGLSGEAKKKAVSRAVEMCFLENVLHQSVDTLSKGYRHRTCFAQSIIHDPDILILDEPTDGLDPNQKHEVRQLIRRMAEKKAIIFSTHILEEVEAVCSRVIIIDRGQIVATGIPEELRRFQEKTTLSLPEPSQPHAPPERRFQGETTLSLPAVRGKYSFLKEGWDNIGTSSARPAEFHSASGLPDGPSSRCFVLSSEAYRAESGSMVEENPIRAYLDACARLWEIRVKSTDSPKGMGHVFEHFVKSSLRYEGIPDAQDRQNASCYQYWVSRMCQHYVRSAFKNDCASASLTNDILEETVSSLRKHWKRLLLIHQLDQRRSRSSLSNLGKIAELLVEDLQSFPAKSFCPLVIRTALKFKDENQFHSEESPVRFLDVFGSAWNTVKMALDREIHLKEKPIDALIRAHHIEIFTRKIPRLKACAIKWRDRLAIFIDESISSDLRPFALLHEMGHLRLEHSGLPDDLFSDEGISPHQIRRCEREEREADLFAKITLHLLKEWSHEKKADVCVEYPRLSVCRTRTTQKSRSNSQHKATDRSQTSPETVDGDVTEVDVRELLDGVDGQGSCGRDETSATQPMRLFYSYSHEDEGLRNELETHLKLLQRSGVVSAWHDRKIESRDDWKTSIDENLERADIILLLVSADFIASNYCYEKEMKRALLRHDAGEARVIPIIVRHVKWKSAPFAKLLSLPKDGKAVMDWPSKAAAWRNVREGIRGVIEMRKSPQSPRLFGAHSPEPHESAKTS